VLKGALRWATRLIALDTDGNILIRDDARRSVVKYRQS
jgi:hypothetical protein